MSFFTSYSNSTAAIINLLKEFKFPVNPKKVDAEIEKHPDFPSLLSISDVLTWFKVSNAAYQVDFENLSSVPTPFIAHTKRTKEFFVVKKISDDKITYATEKNDSITIPLENFKKNYSGFLLTIDLNKSNIPKLNLLDWLASIKTQVASAILVISFIAIFLSISNYSENPSWHFGLFAFFKTAGLLTSVLLLIQSISSNNPLVQALCGGVGKTDCNAILSSDAAVVFKGLSWSEVGFFYFAGTWLVLIFKGGSTPVIQTLAILNILALPYTIYSIIYQAKIAKQWCTFCLIIQAVLWLEFSQAITFLLQPFQTTSTSIITVGLYIIAMIALWIVIKPLLLKIQELDTLKHQLRNFKFNTSIFESNLSEQPKYSQPDNEWSITLGHPNASNVLTIVSNPYCQPCSKMHGELDEILNRLNNIKVKIIFNADNHDKDIKTPVARHLMALNEQQDGDIVKRALNDWYFQKDKNYQAWAKKYPVELNTDKFYKLSKQREWCAMAEIKSTPTIFVNGFQLPNTYRLNDIKYLLN